MNCTRCIVALPSTFALADWKYTSKPGSEKPVTLCDIFLIYLCPDPRKEFELSEHFSHIIIQIKLQGTLNDCIAVNRVFLS